MTDKNISTGEAANSLKIIDDKMKETVELIKKSQEKLNNYSFNSFPDLKKSSPEFLNFIQEQKQINRNITQTVNYVSDKIQLIQNSIIGDPTNLSQVGTILDRLKQLEYSVLPNPTSWPSLRILSINPIATQEENISHTLLSLLYALVDYAKVNSNYRQIKFPLNSNIGECHLRFERRHHNIQSLCGNSIGIVNPKFLQAISVLSNELFFGIILTSNLEFGTSDNIKIIKHRKSFDKLGEKYSSIIELIFKNCPFEIRTGTKEFFLSLPFPGYYKDDEHE